MEKVKLGPQTIVYPMVTFIVGANVNDKANFMTVAWGAIANAEPPMSCIAVRHSRYTNTGIKQNKSYSINIPSINMVKETDFCGITTGAKIDKISVCKFEVFYGILKTAPMISQCPINLECSVQHIIDLGSHDLIIGKIEETYVNNDCLTNNKPDVSKIKPFAYITGHELTYCEIGRVIAKAFNEGKKLRNH